MSRKEQAAIASPGAWLTTVASRVCLNQLASARARRESYVGEWIPEPLPERTGWITGRSPQPTADPADTVTLDESISMAFLVVLETMTPAQRVAFILHDVFGYSFAEIAEIVGRTPAACRQLASTARSRVDASQPPGIPAAHQAGIIRDFKQAWDAKDITRLIGLLDPNATITTDGGGLAPALLHPVQGSQQIAQACVDFARRIPNLTIMEGTVKRPGRPDRTARGTHYGSPRRRRLRRADHRHLDRAQPRKAPVLDSS
jgi:DNA-directed RNA polymerase specialized sigma24 family protein